MKKISWNVIGLIIAILLFIGWLGFTSTNLFASKPFEKEVLDVSVVHPVELQKGWDKLMDARVTPDIYKVWQKIRKDKNYPQPRWAKLSLLESTHLLKYLCEAYEVDYPNRIIQDAKFLAKESEKASAEYRKSQGFQRVQLEQLGNKGAPPDEITVFARTVTNSLTKNVTIYFRSDEIFVLNVVHEFYHLLDFRKNNEFNFSFGEEDICDNSGTRFWNKYVARLCEYEKLQTASNRF